MSLEEKFEAFMKSYQTIASSNLELENQNIYLRRQLEETKRLTKGVEKSPSSSIKKMMVNQVVTLRAHHVRRSLTEGP